MQAQLTITTHETIDINPTQVNSKIQRTFKLTAPPYLFLKKDTTDTLTICRNIFTTETPLANILKSVRVLRDNKVIKDYKVQAIDKNCFAVSYTLGKTLSNGAKTTILVEFSEPVPNTRPLEITYPSIKNLNPVTTQKAGSVNLKIINQYELLYVINKKAFSNAYVLTPTNYKHTTTTNSINLRFSLPDFKDKGVFLLLGNSRYLTIESTNIIKGESNALLNRFTKLNIPVPPNEPLYGQTVFVQNPNIVSGITTNQEGTIYIELSPTNLSNTLRLFAKISYTPIAIDHNARVRDIPQGVYVKWLDPNQYPYNHPTITKIAQSIKDPQGRVLQNIKNVIEYVTNKLEYEKDFLANPRSRRSVLETLALKQGVCMEYADLTITLLHSLGIPARPAFGYLLYSNNITNTNLGEYGHQWVEAYIPHTGWVPVDPTLAETIDYYINPPLAYLFLTRDTEFISYSCLGPLGNCNNITSTYHIKPTNTIPNTEQLIPIDRLKEYVENNSLSRQILSTVETAGNKVVNTLPLWQIQLFLVIAAAGLLTFFITKIRRFVKRATRSEER